MRETGISCRFWKETGFENNHLADRDADGSILLKCIFRSGPSDDDSNLFELLNSVWRSHVCYISFHITGAI